MKREITVDGKPYKVEIDRCDVGTPFSVRVNGEPHEVELEEQPDYKTPFSIKIHGKKYSVELGKVQDEATFPIKVNNTSFVAELKPEARRVALRIPESPVSVLVQKPLKRAVEEGMVVAPMAGKIVSVKVKKGDSVKVGDVVCTLEAMKMENEITALKSGLVEEVLVAEGVAVNEGDVLIVIK